MIRVNLRNPRPQLTLLKVFQTAFAAGVLIPVGLFAGLLLGMIVWVWLLWQVLLFFCTPGHKRGSRR